MKGSFVKVETCFMDNDVFEHDRGYLYVNKSRQIDDEILTKRFSNN